jgi:hypothetical protein
MLDPDSAALKTLSRVVLKLTDKLAARDGVLHLIEETDCHSDDSHDVLRILIFPQLCCPPNSIPKIVNTTELDEMIDELASIELLALKKYSRCGNEN